MPVEFPPVAVGWITRCGLSGEGPGFAYPHMTVDALMQG